MNCTFEKKITVPLLKVIDSITYDLLLVIHSKNLISWIWSLPAPTDPVWWRSMHAISSYRGITPPARPPQTQTGPITIHCARLFEHPKHPLNRALTGSTPGRRPFRCILGTLFTLVWPCSSCSCSSSFLVPYNNRVSFGPATNFRRAVLPLVVSAAPLGKLQLLNIHNRKRCHKGVPRIFHWGKSEGPNAESGVGFLGVRSSGRQTNQLTDNWATNQLGDNLTRQQPTGGHILVISWRQH